MRSIVEKALKRRAARGGQKQHHAALISKGGRPLAWGINKPGVHAEIAALRNMPEGGKGCTLHSLRLLPRHGGLGMAKPCGKCEVALKAAGVRRVVYTNRKGEWETYFL